MEGFELLQNLVSTDEDLGGTIKVEPEGRRQRKRVDDRRAPRQGWGCR